MGDPRSAPHAGPPIIGQEAPAPAKVHPEMPLLTHPGFTVLPDRSVRFRYQGRGARHVRLAGTFTGWAPAPLARNGDAWEMETPPLPEGVHFYKYLVDGRWATDPAHPLVESDG